MSPVSGQGECPHLSDAGILTERRPAIAACSAQSGALSTVSWETPSAHPKLWRDFVSACHRHRASWPP